MTSVSYSFEYPDGFLDTRRHISGNGQKVIFDGYALIGPYRAEGIEIPAYEFGVQTIWHIKVMAAQKEFIANAEVQNPGRYGNSVKIYVYYIDGDGRVAQFDDPYATVKIEFDGEGE